MEEGWVGMMQVVIMGLRERERWGSREYDEMSTY